MSVEFVPFSQCEPFLDWIALTDALVEGHKMPKSELADALLYRKDDTVLNRTAWIDGLGLAVKTATIFPGNGAKGKPTVNGGVSVFSDSTGELEAVLDFRLVTKWKTAGDSLLAARRLARPDSRAILIVGAGAVAHSMVEAFGTLFPDAKFSVWSRQAASANALAKVFPHVRVIPDLEAGVRQADIVSCATMATEPLILGEWLQPGQHIDLIGAYRPDMREVNDMAMQKSRIFVDNRDTTIDHIGELIKPIENGVISASDVVADYYELENGTFERRSDQDITLFKNGGGAHLDLMTGRYILAAWLESK